MESRIKMLMEATGGVIDVVSPICRFSVLGQLSILVFVIAIISFSASYFLRDKKQKNLARVIGICALVLTALLAILYLFSPFIMNQLLGGSQCRV